MLAKSITRSIAQDISRSVAKRSSVDPDSDLQALIDVLYGDGTTGAFYETKPFLLGSQVLFQDLNGTVPWEANGDPIGVMRDLSGRGFNLTANTSSARPVGEDGYADFNGVSSWMINDLASFGHQKTVFIATDSGCEALLDGYGDLTARAFIGDVVYAGSPLAWAIPDNIPAVISVTFDGVSSSVAVNGVEVASGDTGDDLMSGISIGADYNGPPKQTGRLYGLAIVEGVLSEEAFDMTTQYFADLAGVELP